MWSTKASGIIPSGSSSSLEDSVEVLNIRIASLLPRLLVGVETLGVAGHCPGAALRCVLAGNAERRHGGVGGCVGHCELNPAAAARQC
jgi:hypothetical protein